MKKMNKKGFTIVELVIVIAVIAILAAVLIPTFSGVVNKANESSALQTATSAMKSTLAMSDYGTITDKTQFIICNDGKIAYMFSYENNAIKAIENKEDKKLATDKYNSFIVVGETADNQTKYAAADIALVNAYTGWNLKVGDLKTSAEEGGYYKLTHEYYAPAKLEKATTYYKPATSATHAKGAAYVAYKAPETGKAYATQDDAGHYTILDQAGYEACSDGATSAKFKTAIYVVDVKTVEETTANTEGWVVNIPAVGDVHADDYYKFFVNTDYPKNLVTVTKSN